MIDIRIAQASDAQELKKLNDLFNGADSNTAAAIYESLQTNADELVLVAVDGGHLVGFCCGQVCKSLSYSMLYAEVTDLFVLDGYRRRGVGRRLMQLMESALIKRGTVHFHILTRKDNYIAQSLYHSLGFAETSEILLDKSIREPEDRVPAT